MHNLKFRHIGLLCIGLTLTACSSDDDKVQPKPQVNTPPTVSDLMFTTQTESSITDNLNASDAEGDSLSYALTSEPMLGTVAVNSDGRFTYTPNKEATGSDSFMFGVSDGVNSQVSATVDITIEALQVDFAQFVTDALNQDPSAEPLSVNGRVFTNTDADVSSLTPANKH